MHKTLKAETTQPPRANLSCQQHAFDNFRREYNDERPHDSLDGKPPGSLYRRSRREYTGTPPAFEYPGHFIHKRITNAGTFRFKHKLLFIANALKQNTIGLEEIDDGIWSIYFCNVLLGRIDERDYIIRD
jgi:putative transposase